MNSISNEINTSMSAFLRLCLWTMIVPCFVAMGNAQTAAKQPVALKASVGDVTDNRTTGSFNSECKIEVKFTGDAAADATSVRNVRVTKAVDELGRDLVLKEKDNLFSSSSFGGRNNTLKAEVKLRNPSRNAAV